jgi:DNA-binding response OmpR family regulator
MKKRILVIEDDPAIRQGVTDALEFEGYATLSAARGDEGLEQAVRAEVDLVLLDLVLPGKDGLDVLRDLRPARPALPVIILTARGDEADRVKGLRLGADDYVVKPFGVKELLARVQAVLRRTAERPSDIREVKFVGGSADLERREARLAGGGRAELTEREAELLRYLAANAGRAVSRDELLERVWRTDPAGLETRTVDMQVARLREKLRDDPDDPKVLLTVRGKGYMLAAEGRKR